MQRVIQRTKQETVYSRLSDIPRGSASDQIVDGCLVLEGGAFRGLYTQGFLDAMMQNDLNMAVSDVISTYVYRISLLSSNQFELSTAIGLFNSIVNCAMLVIVNKISKKVSDVQLW